MIFSLCLDLDCKSGQGHYQDLKRLNVATSRAKSFTYFIYSPFPKSFDKIYNYLLYNGVKLSDSDFIDNPDTIITYNKLPDFDPSKLESDFERNVYYYLNKFVDEHSNGNLITLHNQIISCGQKRLDFVVYNNDSKKSVAIEVDGSFHFNPNGLKENYTFEHIERMNILTRAGWNIINTPYHKWYKDGWLSEDNNDNFKLEIDRIFNEMKKYLF
jgi:very-short-patch-repair endonuclease